jgi:hypothetical protein
MVRKHYRALRDWMSISMGYLQRQQPRFVDKAYQLYVGHSDFNEKLDTSCWNVNSFLIASCCVADEEGLYGCNLWRHRWLHLLGIKLRELL